MDARRAVAALGRLVHLPDPPGELSVLLLAAGRPGPVRTEGGAGDLQQRARPLDVAPASPLRLDERVDVHRVCVTKKAVARLRISRSSRSLRHSRRSRTSSSRFALVSAPSTRGTRVPLGLLHPRPHRGLSQVEVPRDLAYRPIPLWHNSTISALNSGVNERRGRGFFLPMLSVVGHPSWGEPLMIDVRQSGSGPGAPGLDGRLGQALDSLMPTDESGLAPKENTFSYEVKCSPGTEPSPPTDPGQQ
jgi:hypothetical protein